MRAEMSSSKTPFSFEQFAARFVRREFQCEIHGTTEECSSDSGQTYRGCVKCESEAVAKEEKERLDAELAAKELRDLRERTELCMIPRRFVDKTFENYDKDTDSRSRNFQACKDYADGFEGHFKAGRCMIMSGSVGTGKTHLAISIARHVLQAFGATARYTTVSNLLSDMKSTYGGDSRRTDQDVLDEVIYPNLLILDEVGTTKQSEFEMSTIFNLINARYESMRPTIVISNLGLSQISDAIGERCYDRLREDGGIGLLFMGDSNRKKK
jgi:DNA replication protein DnaC